MTDMPTEALIWSILVTVCLLGMIWLLAHHEHRLCAFEERMAARSRLMRSYRAGCSCWKDEAGRAVCSRCAS